MENAVIQSANQLMELVGLVIVAGLIFGKISEIPFFCSPTNIKTIISLKHTNKAFLNLNHKIKTALENAVNKPFSRAVLFIFSLSTLHTRRDLFG